MTRMCSYLLDLSLIEVAIVMYPPSLRTAAAVCLIRKLRHHERASPSLVSSVAPSTRPSSGGGQMSTRSSSLLAYPVWSRSMRYYTTYDESDLTPMMTIYAHLLVKIKTSKFKVRNALWLVNCLNVS